MPKLDSPDERGDLFVTMRPTLPKDLSEEEIDLIREFKELRTTDAE
jgi:DnaJ-class molecular chaperone